MNKDGCAFVALGTNAAHAGLAGADLLAAALRAIQAAGLPVRRVSSAWTSPAWPQPNTQPDFINAVAALDPAARAPSALYGMLAEIERSFGRERRERWAQRTLDLDLIDLNGMVTEEGGIKVPHPLAQERAFVLAPLAEIAPDWRHPVTGAPVLALLDGIAYQSLFRLGPIAPPG